MIGFTEYKPSNAIGKLALIIGCSRRKNSSRIEEATTHQYIYSWKKVTVHSHNPWQLINMSEYKTSLVTVSLLNNGEHISNIKNVENVRTTCPFKFGSKRGGVKSRFRKSQYLVWPPPALTHAWQRRLMEEIRRLKSGGCSARRGMTMTALKFDKMCFSTL